MPPEFHECFMCGKGQKGNWYVIYGCINKHITEGWRCGKHMLDLKKYVRTPPADGVAACSQCVHETGVWTPFIADMRSELLGNWGDWA